MNLLSKSASSNKISVVIIDDQPGIRQHLTRLIESSESLTVVEVEDNGEDGIVSVMLYRPEVVVLDVSMPGMNGIETAETLCKQWPEVKILAVSAYNYDIYTRGMFDAGARGYLLKDNVSSELVPAITAVASGSYWFSENQSSNQ